MRIICICFNPTIDISSKADMIHPVSKVRTHSESISPGGGGVNVARVLKEFGVPCELVCFSGGATGTLLDEELQRCGLSTRHFRNSAPTRVAFTVHQSSNHQEYRFVPEGPIIDENVFLKCIGYLQDILLQPDDILVVSGSLPRGVPNNAYALISRIACEKRVRMVLDSSGAGLSATLDSGCKVFFVKPSLNELQRLAGCKLDEQGARDYAQDLINKECADHVAVSMGSHGAFLISKGSMLRLPAFLVKLQSAVGAGDSFVGAMIYYLSKGHDIESAFRFGVAAGAAAVMTSADRLCRADDVEALFRSGSKESHI